MLDAWAVAGWLWRFLNLWQAKLGSQSPEKLRIRLLVLHTFGDLKDCNVRKIDIPVSAMGKGYTKGQQKSLSTNETFETAAPSNFAGQLR